MRSTNIRIISTIRSMITNTNNALILMTLKLDLINQNLLAPTIIQIIITIITTMKTFMEFSCIFLQTLLDHLE